MATTSTKRARPNVLTISQREVLARAVRARATQMRPMSGPEAEEFFGHQLNYRVTVSNIRSVCAQNGIDPSTVLRSRSTSSACPRKPEPTPAVEVSADPTSAASALLSAVQDLHAQLQSQQLSPVTVLPGPLYKQLVLALRAVAHTRNDICTMNNALGDLQSRLLKLDAEIKKACG